MPGPEPARPTERARLDAHLELLLEAVARGVPQVMVAHGSSMGAAIPGGARVRLSPWSGGRAPDLGDVVAVRTRDARFFIHRVVGIRADGRFLIKGDACRKPDGWVERGEIKAVVDDIDRGDGWRSLKI